MGTVVRLQMRERSRDASGGAGAIIEGGAEIVILPCVRHERREVHLQHASGFMPPPRCNQGALRQDLPIREPKAV